MKLRLELTKKDLEELIRNKFASLVSDEDFENSFIVIETKSSQNYKSEWEIADFRAHMEINK